MLNILHVQQNEMLNIYRMSPLHSMNIIMKIMLNYLVMDLYNTR